MEVNFFGVVSVTKTFLPLLKRTKGRIINVSSVAGVACGYPLSSAYASSKHAVELFTSSLRQEMKPWGIKVLTITPGFHRTEMNHMAVAGLKGVWERVPEEKKQEYGPDYIQGCEQVVKTFTSDAAYDPVHVINAMEHAVMSTRPRIQYRVGMDAKYGLVWTQLFPLRIGEMIIYGLTTNPAMRAVKGLSPPSPRLQA
jgi:retinol dehydrogenase 16